MSIKSPDPDAEFTVAAVASESASPVSEATPPQRARRPAFAVLAVIVLLAGAIAYYFFWLRAAPSSKLTDAPPVVAPAPPAPAAPAIAHPIDQTPGLPDGKTAEAQAPLPKLDESDAVAGDSIAAFLNGNGWTRLLVPGGLIRQIVVTVDNLPRKTIATRILPVKPVPGAFVTTGTATGMSIAPANAARYGDYVKAADAIDAKRLVEFYVRLYPLFQQAYVELGYPNGYFNDRLVGVIDHLLAAPEPKAPIALTQPKVMYQFADPALADLSAGQKIMVRVGLANESRLKAKLREIRKALVVDPPRQ